MPNTNLKKSIICNAILAILELIGIIISYIYYGLPQYQYFTENVNLFSFIASTLYCCYGIRELKQDISMPKFIFVLRNMAAINLMMIFLVCLTGALTGYDGYSFEYIMFADCSLFFHTLCPIVSTLIAFFVEKSGYMSFKESFIALALPVLYVIIILPLNILHIVHGPYTYLYVYEVPVSTVVLSAVCVCLLTIFLCFLYTYIKNKIFLLSQKSN